jgi:TolB-like protein
VLGQLLADEVISALSHSPEVNVISRLSTSAFQGRDLKLDDASAYLRADYVLSGSYHADADRVTLKAEMAEIRTMQVVWSQTLKGSINGVIAGDDPLAGRLVSEACAAMMVRELQRSQGKAPQSLQNHTLLLSSIALMHRISPLAFDRAQQLLHVLIERTPRLASPYAWMAKWHVLRVTQGWSADSLADGKAALDNTKRALDRDATLSLAMTVEGQVNTYILKRLDVAEQFYAQALQSNPNDSLAWLLKGTLHAFRDEGKEALRHTRHALKLSAAGPTEVLLRLARRNRRTVSRPERTRTQPCHSFVAIEPNTRIDTARADRDLVAARARRGSSYTCPGAPQARPRLPGVHLSRAVSERGVRRWTAGCAGA